MPPTEHHHGAKAKSMISHVIKSDVQETHILPELGKVKRARKNQAGGCGENRRVLVEMILGGNAA